MIPSGFPSTPCAGTCQGAKPIGDTLGYVFDCRVDATRGPHHHAYVRHDAFRGYPVLGCIKLEAVVSGIQRLNSRGPWLSGNWAEPAKAPTQMRLTTAQLLT